MHFDPANIQAIGIGLGAFLSALIASFLFLSARREELGRAMAYTLLAITVWAWFGFAYHLVQDADIARNLRIVSIIGIVWVGIMNVNLAYIYAREALGNVTWATLVRRGVFVCGTALSLLMLLDLFGAHLFVGVLAGDPSEVLAPSAGPLFTLLVAFYALAIVITALLFMARIAIDADPKVRRQSEILFASIVLALTLGGTRFTPWYGFDFLPLLGALPMPLFAFAAFYSIKTYRLLNIEIAAAQILIFVIWTFTFFRILLNPSLVAAIPDLGLFVAVFILGLFLLRSMIMELRAQKELALLTIERAKSEFVTIAAHQLRTPIAALRWIFGLLLSDQKGGLSPEQRDLVQKGSRAADSMLALANDLLDVDRISSGKFTFEFELGDIRDAVRVAAGIMEQTAAVKNIRITLHLADTLPSTTYDRGKLALALENVLDNAIKYSLDGASVGVTVTHDDHTIRISVADTGIGLSKVDAGRMFEKFFRSARAIRLHTDGSGLGLFITKTIIEGHGGRVSMASEGENRGTIVTIELPVRV